MTWALGFDTVFNSMNVLRTHSRSCALGDSHDENERGEGVWDTGERGDEGVWDPSDRGEEGVWHLDERGDESPPLSTVLCTLIPSSACFKPTSLP